MKLKYHWTVNDDGLHIYEEGVRCIRICCWSHVAKIDPDQFKHLVAPYQREFLKFLKRQVDNCQSEANRTRYHPNVSQDLFRARNELKEYRLSLQREGVKI